MEQFLFRVKLVGFFLCFTLLCEAKVKLPALISDGMVLQREQNVRVWGWADPNESVTINFRKKKYTTQADAEGNWTITLPPTKAGGPYTMYINELEIKNVLMGDVYLCSGQSNMELPINRVTDLYQEEVEAYTNPSIRYVKVPLKYDFNNPLEDIDQIVWKELNPTNAMQFSALAYFFAQKIYEDSKTPVGVINSSVGGSPVEAWISEEGLKPFPKYLNERDLYRSDEENTSARNAECMKNDRWNKLLNKSEAGLHDSVNWFRSHYK